MEPREGAGDVQPMHVDSEDVDLHEIDNNELNASIAGTSLPAVVFVR